MSALAECPNCKNPIYYLTGETCSKCNQPYPEEFVAEYKTKRHLERELDQPAVQVLRGMAWTQFALGLLFAGILIFSYEIFVLGLLIAGASMILCPLLLVIANIGRDINEIRILQKGMSPPNR